jgi:hypothetical protein
MEPPLPNPLVFHFESWEYLLERTYQHGKRIVKKYFRTFSDFRERMIYRELSLPSIGYDTATLGPTPF